MFEPSCIQDRLSHTHTGIHSFHSNTSWIFVVKILLLGVGGTDTNKTSLMLQSIGRIIWNVECLKKSHSLLSQRDLTKWQTSNGFAGCVTLFTLHCGYTLYSRTVLHHNIYRNPMMQPVYTFQEVTLYMWVYHIFFCGNIFCKGWLLTAITKLNLVCAWIKIMIQCLKHWILNFENPCNTK